MTSAVRFPNFLPVVLFAFMGLTSGCTDSVLNEGQKTETAADPQTKGEQMTSSKTNGKNPIVLMKTSMGDVKIELFKDKAPISVENFLGYVNKKHYDGLIFHRVIPGFMIQGGGMNADMSEKKTDKPIKNEADNGLKNEVGTLAMARTMVVDSATSQFFINVKNNTFLDHRDKSPQGYGYAVFGKVVDGMDVVTKIEKVKTTTKYPHDDVPVEAVSIQSMTVQ